MLDFLRSLNVKHCKHMGLLGISDCRIVFSHLPVRAARLTEVPLYEPPVAYEHVLCLCGLISKRQGNLRAYSGRLSCSYGKTRNHLS